MLIVKAMLRGEKFYMLNIKTNLANRNNYGVQRPLSNIKYIVIHYTSNDGDTDEGNGNYFKNNIVKASAHYFVDSNSVTQAVPDNFTAWAVGGEKYNDCKVTGGGYYYGVCTNSNSISIELCDDIKNGVVYPSEATIENTLELVKMLMDKYNIKKEYVIRHFDVNGKRCPAYWCGADEGNMKWREEFYNKIGKNIYSEDDTVEKLVSLGITDKANASYWENALSGKEPINKDYVRTMFERLMAKCE